MHKGRKLIAELTFDEVMYMWRNLVKWDGRSFNLFIDSPFCIEKCGFCIYQSAKTRIGSNCYEKYYNEYLPRLLDQFREVLDMRAIDSVYFGGGTSSLMTSDIMVKLFDAIPHFEDIPHKLFESNPATTSPKKLDVLKAYNFDYVTFGLQTFDKEITEQQGRIPLNEDKLKMLIDYAQNHGRRLIVNTDILAYIELGQRPFYSCLKRVENDMRKLALEFRPDVADVYPMYQRFSDENPRMNYKLAYGLRKVLIKVENEIDGYSILNKPNSVQLDSETIMRDSTTNLFFSRITQSEWDRVRCYNSSGYYNSPAHQNTLGLGGYGDRRPYSYFGEDYYYEMQNDNWEPKFLLYRGKYPLP